MFGLTSNMWVYMAGNCFEALHFFRLGKKKTAFYNFFMDYSWSIKFQFHFEMCPGRMHHKCQHIQHHELKMISACYSALLQSTITSSFFLKKRKNRRNGLEFCLSPLPLEQQNTNYYLPSSSLVLLLLKILSQGCYQCIYC